MQKKEFLWNRPRTLEPIAGGTILRVTDSPTCDERICPARPARETEEDEVKARNAGHSPVVKLDTMARELGSGKKVPSHTEEDAYGTRYVIL